MALAVKSGRERFQNSGEATLLAVKWVAEVLQYQTQLTAVTLSSKKHPHPVATGRVNLHDVFNPFKPKRKAPATPQEKRRELKHLAAVIFGEEKAKMVPDLPHGKS